MSSVTLDASLHTKLGACREPVEVCDPHGRRVGYFFPEPVLADVTAAKAQCPYTEEQLAEARKQRTGKPLSEVWDSLRKKGVEIP